jgi:membrane-associated protein
MPGMLGPLAPQHLIDVLGVVGVLLILFAETGLLIGFVLPGDSLLFVAGYATVAGNSLPGDIHLPLGWLLLAAAAGAILGAQVGHEIGRRAGPALFRRPESRFFKPRYVEEASGFLGRVGTGRSIVLARLVPIVRTFLNPICGAAGVHARTFLVWNVVGGIAWTVGLILLGHAIGDVSFVRDHIEVLAILVVVLSFVPIAAGALRQWLRSRAAAS